MDSPESPGFLPVPGWVLSAGEPFADPKPGPAPGQRVYRGQDLVSIESMKMESFVASPRDGEVEGVLVGPGQAVERGDALLTFKV